MFELMQYVITIILLIVIIGQYIMAYAHDKHLQEILNTIHDEEETTLKAEQSKEIGQEKVKNKKKAISQLIWSALHRGQHKIILRLDCENLEILSWLNNNGYTVKTTTAGYEVSWH